MTLQTLEPETAVERPAGGLVPTTAGPSWKVALRRAAQKFSLDQCTDVAAMLTYYSMLSLFPGLVAVVSLIGVFNIQPDDLIDIFAGVLNKSASDSMFDTPRSILERFSSQGGAGFALVIGVLGALWSASGYVGGFSRALNRIYDVGEGRSVFKLRPWLYLITAIQVVLMVAVLVAMVFSGSVASEVGSKIGLGDTTVAVWNIAKWPVVVLFVILIISLLYWATPNVRKPRRMFFSWGAAFGFLAWVIASGAFFLYVTLTGGSSYNKTYGPFAGAVIFLLWLWLTNLALLFGAELDAELERTRQLRSGLPAEEMILLPARDSTGLEKKAEKYDDAVREAHALRLASDHDPELAGKNFVPALAVRRSNERTASAMTASTEDPTRPATRRVDGTTDTYGRSEAARLREATHGQPYDAAREREIVRLSREERRETALVEAAHNRQVRDRLEAQEARAKAARQTAERKAKEEREALESQVTREERWAEVDRVRSRFDPRRSVARDEVYSERQARRSEFDVERAEQAARPEPPKKQEKAVRTPMPSPLRSEVEQEREDRRSAWYAARRPAPAAAPVDGATPEPQFRRDRRAQS
ncbi:YhjD/YihY/BrkB family envelope integrity protein [Luteipulveratus sp. YIM 133132]|uniref:YihY/virulence factor BrkB family protein n=1 Tax=Luteipulveratus flavus TaxID=3031728 RepID=UPI0023AEBDA3|nr:YhjD/YihY/BrkB family envelope integrity protein [Luteipulveratus sp. YIM 133132]MDE9366305.1 YhjD/YihY/BrkB family envelope integrity protein [Luteipulveratus sp. YIM 133132]